jgi:hypothetical protein
MQALSDYFAQTKIAALGIRLLRLERGRRARPPRQPQRFRRWIDSIYDSLKGRADWNTAVPVPLRGVFTRGARRLLALAACI